MNDELKAEDFREWLALHPNAGFRACDCYMCPIAAWLDELHPEMSVRVYGTLASWGGKGHELPAWVTDYVYRLDARFKSQRNLLGSEALAVLLEGEK